MVFHVVEDVGDHTGGGEAENRLRREWVAATVLMSFMVDIMRK